VTEAYLGNVVVLTKCLQFRVEFTDAIFMRFISHFCNPLCELGSSEISGFLIRLRQLTLRFCTWSNRFSASVFLVPFVPAPGEFRVFVDGDPDLDLRGSSSPDSTFFTRSRSRSSSTSALVPFDFDFFFFLAIISVCCCTKFCETTLTSLQYLPRSLRLSV
jgi:hypothetical protein